MAAPARKTYEAVWLEPLAALILLIFALYINQSVSWPYIWAIDVVTCAGAAISYKRPGWGAVLAALSLAVWLPFETAAGPTGLAFYINIFAASRKNLTWKAPLILALGGLAYLALVRKSLELLKDQWATSIILLILLAASYGGGLAFRYASQRIQREQDTGDQRVQNLQVALARELHDSVAQTLSSAAMRANIIMSDPSLSPMAVDQLERIADECRSSAHDLRQLLSALRDAPESSSPPGPLADVASLRRTVEAQAERLRREGFSVEVDIAVTKLSAARCQTLGAIAVEAANNIVKHARPGTACTFTILQGKEDVVGNFSNVRGMSSTTRRGLGLTGVQERLTLLKGTSRTFVKDGWWTLNVTLPLGIESSLRPPSPVQPPDSVLFGRVGS